MFILLIKGPDHKDICDFYKIKSYPTLKYFYSNGTIGNLLTYQQSRSLMDY